MRAAQGAQTGGSALRGRPDALAYRCGERYDLVWVALDARAVPAERRRGIEIRLPVHFEDASTRLSIQ